MPRLSTSYNHRLTSGLRKKLHLVSQPGMFTRPRKLSMPVPHCLPCSGLPLSPPFSRANLRSPATKGVAFGIDILWLEVPHQQVVLKEADLDEPLPPGKEGGGGVMPPHGVAIAPRAGTGGSSFSGV
jgi:hypothetical protein